MIVSTVALQAVMAGGHPPCLPGRRGSLRRKVCPLTGVQDPVAVWSSDLRICRRAGHVWLHGIVDGVTLKPAR
jgi:hypothetical protein